jgi:hypothetical protein
MLSGSPKSAFTKHTLYSADRMMFLLFLSLYRFGACTVGCLLAGSGLRSF